jgi:hypothetical protein
MFAQWTLLPVVCRRTDDSKLKIACDKPATKREVSRSSSSRSTNVSNLMPDVTIAVPARLLDVGRQWRKASKFASF